MILEGTTLMTPTPPWHLLGCLSTTRDTMPSFEHFVPQARVVMERSIHKVEMIWKWHECHFPNRIFKKHLTIYLKYLVEKGKIKIDKGIYEII